MFNMCIKHMNKVLDCYKTYEVGEDYKFVNLRLNICLNLMCELNIYLSRRMLQSQKGKDDTEYSNLCNHFLIKP